MFKRIGTISGTPSAAGTATVQVTAKDANGKARTDEFTVTIEASSTPVDAKPTAVALTGTIVSSLAEDTVTTNSVKIAVIAVTDDGQGTDSCPYPCGLYPYWGFEPVTPSKAGEGARTICGQFTAFAARGDGLIFLA